MSMYIVLWVQLMLTVVKADHDISLKIFTDEAMKLENKII